MKPVVALDIDGTLGDYHGHFLKFAEGWLGRRLPPSWRNTDGVPLYRWIGVDIETYRRIKLAYRQGGLKRTMPAYQYAGWLTRRIRESCELWICTTRPYEKLDNVDPDTREWLQRNGVQYDFILYGKDDKYKALVEQVAQERIVLVVDDLPEVLEYAKVLGLPAAIRDQPYNRYWVEPPEMPRVNNMHAIERLVEPRVKEYSNDSKRQKAAEQQRERST
jgi:hypothetical protein